MDKKFINMLSAAADYFDPSSLVCGEKPVDSVPNDYYITNALSDSTVAYIQCYAQWDKPFFVYLSYTAPHWPRHALEEDIKNTKKYTKSDGKPLEMHDTSGLKNQKYLTKIRPNCRHGHRCNNGIPIPTVCGMRATKGAVTSQPCHIIDIMATCIEVANTCYPEIYRGYDMIPLEGKSFVPVLQGKQRDGHLFVGFEHFNGKALWRADGWKALQPFPHKKSPVLSIKCPYI